MATNFVKDCGTTSTEMSKWYSRKDSKSKMLISLLRNQSLQANTKLFPSIKFNDLINISLSYLSIPIASHNHAAFPM